MIFRRLTPLAYFSLLFLFTLISTQSTASTVELEELTSKEVHDRIANGTNVILVPVGGTEQSGPYLVLGKHNFRVHYLAEKIAQKLGNALVAPVVSYVPEGSIEPPTGHMRFAGTISIPDAAFDALLEGVARSFKQHDFHTIIFLGDHGGYQQNLQRVAQKLNKEWASHSGVHVLALSDYYRLSSTGFDAVLKKYGFTDAVIGAHAGLADTALTLAINEHWVRSEALLEHPKPTTKDGVVGDPRQATAELGQLGVQLIVDGSVAAIQAELQPKTK